MWSDAGRRPRSSSSAGESARTPNTTATRVWPIIFARLRRPRLRCRLILMKSSRNPTVPSPTNRNSSSIAEADGGLQGDQLRREVADHRGRDDDDAAHGGRAALGVVGGRAVVADLLAVAAPAQHLDRVARADQRDQQRETATEQDRSHAVLPSVPPGRRPAVLRRRLPSAAPRDAFTRTTSAAETFSPQPGQCLVTPRRDDRLTRRATHRGHPRARPRPTVTSTSTPRPRGEAADPRVRARAASAPSSNISPSTATVRRPDAPADDLQRLQRGLHRLGVGVVGVVDDDRAVGALADLHPPAAGRARRREARRRRCRGRPRRRGPSPRRRRRCATGRRRPGEVHGRTGRRGARGRRTGGRARRGEVAPPRTSAGAAPKVGTRATVRARHRGDQRVVGVEHGGAVGGSASTISPLACAMASRLPNSPMWAVPTLRTAATGAGRSCTGSDVPDAAGAHLDDEEAGLGVGAQHGQRDADLVVERCPGSPPSGRRRPARGRGSPWCRSCPGSRSGRARWRRGAGPTRGGPAPRAPRRRRRRPPWVPRSGGCRARRRRRPRAPCAA